MKTKQEILKIISHAHGTEQYYRYSPFSHYPKITDGVKAVAEAAECFWLLDIIGSYQSNMKLDPAFQVWKVSVKPDRSASVRGYNDNGNKLVRIITQKVEWTDFPLESLKLYVIRNVILLPSEY